MHLSTAQKIGAGFAAALLILVAGLLSLATARRAFDAAQWVAHTHEVSGHLDALLGALVEVETGQRGYIITGAPHHLESYGSAERRVATELAAIRRLTVDNARQQERLDSLAPVVAARLASARAIATVRRTQGFSAAAALVGTDRGKRLMDEARRRIAVMHAEERALLDQRTGDRAAQERLTAVVTLLGAVVAFALVALMIRVIQQDVALQQRTARERDALLEGERAARAQLAAIQRITDATLTPLALDHLLAELLQRVREALAVDTACVHLVMRDGVHLELCKCVGPTEEIGDRARVPVGHGVIGAIARSRTPAVVADLKTADVVDPVLQERFSSLLGAPLVVPARVVAGGAIDAGPGEQLIGVVHVESIAPRVFSDDERTLLAYVAERAASAIERARLYQAERRVEERFRLLVDRVRDYAIFTLDPAGRIMTWNPGAERLKGWRADEIVGQPLATLYPPEGRARGEPEQHLRTAEVDGHSVAVGWRQRKDGSHFWAEAALTTLRDEDDGHLIGFAKVTRDLTEQRRAEEALREGRDLAEAANAAKTRFLAMMSHEIRTPINAVLGYTDLLDLGLDGPLTDAQRERLARIRASGRHLLGLVNELLDLAKIEAEQLRVERVRASASEAVATALSLVSPQAMARSLSVTTRCVPLADAAYMGDPHRVEQVLVNLLSNAVKFTPSGGRVEIECGLTDTPATQARLSGTGPADPSCWCYLRVSDSGAGIAPELRDAVFEPFVQAPPPSHATGAAGGTANPYTREHGGTGLGLAISRRLARLMGGDLTLESEPGMGATFTLWLPAPPEVRSAATLAERPSTAADGAAGCTTEERRTGLRTVAGLARAGHALRDRTPQLLAVHVQRLRTEFGMPEIAALPDGELEDHLGTLLTEVARSLVLIEEALGETTRTLRDGTAIQRVLAERYGAQRATLGWRQEDVRRELGMLREGIEAALRDALVDPAGTADAPPAATLAAALDVVARLLAHVERVGVGAWRMAKA